MKTFLPCLFLTCFFSHTALAQSLAETLTRPAGVANVSISPNGDYLAYIENEGDEDYLRVISTSDQSTVSKTSFGDGLPIRSVLWATEERMVVTLSVISYSFSSSRPVSNTLIQRQMDSMNYSGTGQSYAVDADGGNYQIITGNEVRSTTSIQTRESDRPVSSSVVDLLPDDPEHIIIQDFPFGIDNRPPRSNAYMVNINTGWLSKIIGSPVINSTFYTDANHEVRYVSGVNLEGVQQLYGLDRDKEWQLLKSDDGDGSWFDLISPYGDEGAMLVRGVGDTTTRGYSVWSPDTNMLTPLYYHEQIDADGTLTDEENQVWAIRYHDHFPEYAYPDQSHPYANLHMQLRQSLSAFDVSIVDATSDFSKVIVYITGPQNPGEYLLMDTTKMQFLMRIPRHKDFPVDRMGRMDPFEMTARDGTLLKGFLSLPTGVEENNLPLVVMPHDGPHDNYDTWGYNNWVQLFASNGYAVLQVNYRGSGGRGEDFEQSGYGEWGGIMSSDLIDAVNWAVNDGIADSERICIMGRGMYAGYAALTASFQVPDLFQCVVGITGNYDMSLMLEAQEESTPGVTIVDPGMSALMTRTNEDESLFERLSPVENADKISANVLLIHDKINFWSPIKHAENMKDALEDAGHDEIAWLTENSSRKSIMRADNIANVFQQTLDFVNNTIGD